MHTSQKGSLFLNEVKPVALVGRGLESVEKEEEAEEEEEDAEDAEEEEEEEEASPRKEGELLGIAWRLRPLVGAVDEDEWVTTMEAVEEADGIEAIRVERFGDDVAEAEVEVDGAEENADEYFARREPEEVRCWLLLVELLLVGWDWESSSLSFIKLVLRRYISAIWSSSCLRVSSAALILDSNAWKSTLLVASRSFISRNLGSAWDGGMTSGSGSGSGSGPSGM